MNFGEILLKVLSAQGMWAGVLSTLTFVTIGFIITRRGLFNQDQNNKISKFTISYILPFLCVYAFMQNSNTQIGKEFGVVLGLSISFYFIMAIVSWAIIKYWPYIVSKKVNKRALELYEQSDKVVTGKQYQEAYVNSYKQKILTIQMMLSYGSLQFFAFPLIISMQGSVFGPYTLALAQTWCIPFMVLALCYVSIMYSGQKFSKKTIKPIIKTLTNPSMCLLYFSLLMWIIQFIPGANGYYAIVEGKPYTPVNVNFAKAEGLKYGQFWGGFLINLPALGNVVTIGVKIVSPLAWLVIGGTLAKSDLKKAAKDKSVWLATGLKLLLMPAILFAIMIIFVYPFNGQSILSVETATLLVLFASTPPATVCIMFSVAHKHEHSTYTAEVSSLATLMCLVAMPLWIVISHATYTAMKIT